MISSIFFFLIFTSFVIPRDIIISDGKCYDQYVTETARVYKDLVRESERKFDLQLTAMEDVLQIPHPDCGYKDPYAVPLCTLIQPPTNYTLNMYNLANNLQLFTRKANVINNRILHRLLLIQKKILENHSILYPQTRRVLNPIRYTTLNPMTTRTTTTIKP